MNTIRIGVWLAAGISASYALGTLIIEWDRVNGAPQQAALAAFAVATMIGPYIIARAIDGAINSVQATLASSEKFWDRVGGAVLAAIIVGVCVVPFGIAGLPLPR